MKRHIEFTSPDIVIYCLYNENQDEMMTVNEVRKRLGHSSTFVIVGAAEDCDEFQEKSEVPFE